MTETERENTSRAQVSSLTKDKVMKVRKS